MNTITKILVLLTLCLAVNISNAQDTIQQSIKQKKVEKLLQQREQIEKEERDLLKTEVERITARLESGDISQEQADRMKQEAAEKRALNIENRLAIIDNAIALVERNQYDEDDDEDVNRLTISFGKAEKGIKFTGKDEPPKYDIRTTNDLLFAIGFNNAIIEGQDLDDSPYKIGGSGFVELGWIWNTRLLEESNFIRMRYGFSFQWNKLSIKDNLYFVENGDETNLEEFPLDLKKSKFRTTSLVVPLHFEFGPSDKIDKGSHIRFRNEGHFKIGLGGFAGVNLGTQQKLKFEEDGDNVKQKTKSDFNTSPFVYGLSGYIGVGDFSVYAKYNLNPIFKDQQVEQRNVSLGLRWDFD